MHVNVLYRVAFYNLTQHLYIFLHILMVLMIHHALTHIISHVSRGHRVFWVLTHCTPSPGRPSQGWSGLGWCLHGSSSATAVFRPFQLPQLLLAFPPEGPCNAQEVGLGSPVTGTGDGLRHCVTNDSDTLGIRLVTDPTMMLTRPWPDPACPSCPLPHPDCCSGLLLIHTHPHLQLEQLTPPPPPPPTPDLLVATWLTNSLHWSLNSAWSAATCASHFLSFPQFLHQPLLDPQTLSRMNGHMNSFYAAERKCQSVFLWPYSAMLLRQPKPHAEVLADPPLNALDCRHWRHSPAKATKS